MGYLIPVMDWTTLNLACSICGCLEREQAGAGNGFIKTHWVVEKEDGKFSD